MDFQHGHRQQQQQMNNVGLTRYRSAPSSYFTSFLDTADNITGSSSGQGMDDLDHFLNRFMPNNSVQGQESINPINNFTNTTMNLQSQTQFVVGTMKQEPPEVMQQEQQPLGGLDYSQMMFQSQDSAEVEVQRNQNTEASNKLLSSANSNRLAPMKMSTGGGGGANSNLIRYNSSPAGFFDNLNLDNEYGAMRGVGSFGAGHNANAEASFSSASRFKGFSSGQSSSGLMPSISEIGIKGMGESSSSHRNDDGYITGFPVNSWDDSSMLSENLLKGLGTDNKTFSNVAASGNQFVNQGNEGQNDPPPTMLSRHMSLPSTSVEFSAMETLMQDSVLCKMRAKRGCATHPRSIAERVRRTRISERMRRLQEAVPNMDKQTNTSDMLDLAVDYIKDLQQQVEILLDNRAKCTCPNE